MTSKNAALDALSVLRALRSGNPGLTRSITDRHKADASDILQNLTAFCLSFLDAIDEVCSTTGYPMSSDEMLTNLQNGIMLHGAAD